MKLYNVSDLALNNKGEYVLGSADLHTHACYFIYGILKKGDKGRLIKPGKGHEEIVCLVSGEVKFMRDKESFILKPGQAFYLKGDETYMVENNGNNDAVYVIAGGHSEGHEH